jgi:hypothetical protein
MKDYRCFPVQANGVPLWEVQEAEFGSEFTRKIGSQTHETETDCRVEVTRLSRIAMYTNG